MGRADFWEEGSWNVRCSMCNAKRKASQMVRNWQGMYRCPIHNEVRHPQDYVRATPDIQTPPWTQPGGQTTLAVCTAIGLSCVIDYAIIDCAIIDYVPANLDSLDPAWIP